MRRLLLLLCGLFIILSGCLPSLAQNADINRYTLFTGFDYMISPARNLTERGFETDFGVTAAVVGTGRGLWFPVRSGHDYRDRDGICSGGEWVVGTARRGLNSRSLQLDHLHVRGRTAILYTQVGKNHFPHSPGLWRHARKGGHNVPG